MVFCNWKKPGVGTILNYYRTVLKILCSAQYYKQHCTFHAFERFGALYIHSPNDKYPTRPGIEPSTHEVV